jgi:hypothetical protein
MPIKLCCISSADAATHVQHLCRRDPVWVQPRRGLLENAMVNENRFKQRTLTAGTPPTGACTACPLGAVTLSSGAISSTECGCSADFWGNPTTGAHAALLALKSPCFGLSSWYMARRVLTHSKRHKHQHRHSSASACLLQH